MSESVADQFKVASDIVKRRIDGLLECGRCGAVFSPRLSRCPGCGRPNPYPDEKREEVKTE